MNKESKNDIFGVVNKKVCSFEKGGDDRIKVIADENQLRTTGLLHEERDMTISVAVSSKPISFKLGRTTIVGVIHRIVIKHKLV